MICRIVGALVSCALGLPPLSPAEALLVLERARPPYVYVRPAPRAYGPTVVVIGQTDVPDWRVDLCGRRLDGTSQCAPPTIYGGRVPAGDGNPRRRGALTPRQPAFNAAPGTREAPRVVFQPTRRQR